MLISLLLAITKKSPSYKLNKFNHWTGMNKITYSYRQQNTSKSKVKNCVQIYKLNEGIAMGQQEKNKKDI